MKDIARYQYSVIATQRPDGTQIVEQLPKEIASMDMLGRIAMDGNIMAAHAQSALDKYARRVVCTENITIRLED